MTDELRARAREATLQSLTAGLIGAIEGDRGPMAEVMGALDRSVAPEEHEQFVAAMLMYHCEVIGYLVTMISGLTGQSLQQVWQGVASGLAQRPGP